MKVTKCSIIEFRKQFDSDAACLAYLANQKWGNGYSCRKCNHPEYKKGDMHIDRRCKKCGYNESPTSNTLFHSIKMPLTIAFEMLFRISVNKKGISSIALSREYGVNQKTAYHFRQKVQDGMKSSGKHPLTGIVHVDEFVYGGQDEGCPGRSSESDKLKISVAVEIVNDKKTGKQLMGRAYAISIQNYSHQELGKIFEKHISKEANVVTDKWTGYIPIGKDYSIEQIKSEKGSNFPCIHILIMNIKTWIRGIHHKISHQHVQEYLNEFCFRFNRRTWIDRMPIFILNNMVANPPNPVKLTKGGYYG